MINCACSPISGDLALISVLALSLGGLVQWGSSTARLAPFTPVVHWQCIRTPRSRHAIVKGAGISHIVRR